MQPPWQHAGSLVLRCGNVRTCTRLSERNDDDQQVYQRLRDEGKEAKARSKRSERQPSLCDSSIWVEGKSWDGVGWGVKVKVCMVLRPRVTGNMMHNRVYSHRTVRVLGLLC